MATRARRLLFGLLLAAGCREEPAPAGAGEAPAPPPSAAPAPTASSAATAPRRPRRRHYFARSADRCEVYTEEGDTLSPAAEAVCPEESVLARGERIRLSGKTCMRESPADPSREVPVICPGPLIELDRDAHGAQDGGP